MELKIPTASLCADLIFAEADKCLAIVYKPSFWKAFEKRNYNEDPLTINQRLWVNDENGKLDKDQ